MNIDLTLPDDAPFTDEQRQWLNDFLAQKLADAQPAQGRKITILWGSQTGNSEVLAKKTGKALAKVGFTPNIVDMAEYDHAQLASEEHLLIITSTYGDGDPPDNAMDFHAWLLSDEAPKLENLKYSVLALGDTDYPDFCICGIEFDQRLAALGAEKIHDRIDCDVDYDDNFALWRSGILAALGTESVATESVEDEGPQGFGKKNPFPSEILKNYNLNGEGSSKQTQHIELSLDGSELQYEAGDALGVMPLNPPALVDEILAALPFNTKEEVPLPGGGEAPLRDALIAHYDIRKLTKAFLVAWQKRSGSPMLRAIIESDDKVAIDDFIWGRELVDLVLDHPADFEDGEDFVSVLKKLQPRLYSIASSPKAHPGEVHLTVAIVRYHSHYRDRGGVCSTFLSDRSEGLKPGVFVHTNKAFRLPENTDTDVIMVGPGTGIAPFRAFLEERQATEAKGRNWLFFGDQHVSCDFLYEEELKGMQENGTLTRLDTAFSRDQKEKIYVQNRMLENGAELWQWLENGASFYVCGDASRMAKDVDAALTKIAQDHGGMSELQAVDYIKDLRKEKRYCRDVY
ncbi:sulfite reductase subunit alpha [Verrucomicrobiaceae bacterium 5K15]|uniref:assimilatory sulfite reductase (NADPH) n=1 Tax=Oceaniferula flava TaxID=2800421 RepID=A0AAE2VCL8_9BACT|nr:sulfite reductase subunit alpha [Oceaniferula flavus]MBK1855810.1 sulfite reductase subunit alpha [Oceaniferula flavus]MBM1137117.1 sulfite reductase subunit alpha [Oceaniferula flavus]